MITDLTYLELSKVVDLLNCEELQTVRNNNLELDSLDVYKRLDFAIKAFNQIYGSVYYDLVQIQIHSLDEELQQFVSNRKLLFMIRNFEQKVVGSILSEADSLIEEKAMECLENQSQVLIGCSNKMLEEAIRTARRFNIKYYTDSENNRYFRYKNPESMYLQLCNAVKNNEDKRVLDLSLISEATARIYATRLKKKYSSDIKCSVYGNKVIFYFSPQTKESIFQDKLRSNILSMNPILECDKIIELCSQVAYEFKTEYRPLIHEDLEDEFLEENPEFKKMSSFD